MKIWLASLEQQAGGMSAVNLGVGASGLVSGGGLALATQLSFQVEKGQAGIAAECQQAAVMRGFLRLLSASPAILRTKIVEVMELHLSSFKS